jgi:hypothetical protein
MVLLKVYFYSRFIIMIDKNPPPVFGWYGFFYFSIWVKSWFFQITSITQASFFQVHRMSLYLKFHIKKGAKNEILQMQEMLQEV